MMVLFSQLQACRCLLLIYIALGKSVNVLNFGLIGTGLLWVRSYLLHSCMDVFQPPTTPTNEGG